jgi:outer membrane protein OmpA-like peptidoglycan-associated protein
MLYELPLRSFMVEPEVDIKAHFKRGSSELEEDSLKEVKNLAKVLQSADFNEINNITIVGHADVTGDADPVVRRERNQQLSIERANTVKNFLATQGNLSEKNFTVQGKGDTQPLINMDTQSAYKANRRVEIILN